MSTLLHFFSCVHQYVNTSEGWVNEIKHVEMLKAASNFSIADFFSTTYCHVSKSSNMSHFSVFMRYSVKTPTESGA